MNTIKFVEYRDSQDAILVGAGPTSRVHIVQGAKETLGDLDELIDFQVDRFDEDVAGSHIHFTGRSISASASIHQRTLDLVIVIAPPGFHIMQGCLAILHTDHKFNKGRDR